VSIAEHKYTNRLAHESSPYLLQHQHNPVDWYPWGPEALERARREDKPIFLSVGYSTCYWCHVMERQCFENEAVAREMNERFINIKVDREERPDIDQLYMMAVQVLTHHGGWPMSVWLTPDLRPFYAGTYFPPEDVHGRPGFVTVLRALDDYYRNRRDEVERAASELHQILRQLATPMRASVPVQVDDEIAHVRVVHRPLSRRLPGVISLSVVRIDADDVEFVEVAELDTVERHELTAKDQMKKLLLRFLARLLRARCAHDLPWSSSATATAGCFAKCYRGPQVHLLS